MARGARANLQHAQLKIVPARQRDGLLNGFERNLCRKAGGAQLACLASGRDGLNRGGGGQKAERRGCRCGDGRRRRQHRHRFHVTSILRRLSLSEGLLLRNLGVPLLVHPLRRGHRRLRSLARGPLQPSDRGNGFLLHHRGARAGHAVVGEACHARV